jgi:hypothetical protein
MAEPDIAINSVVGASSWNYPDGLQPRICGVRWDAALPSQNHPPEFDDLRSRENVCTVACIDGFHPDHFPVALSAAGLTSALHSDFSLS